MDLQKAFIKRASDESEFRLESLERESGEMLRDT